MVFSLQNPEVRFVTGPIPIPPLAYPYTAELELPSDHSYSYALQSSPALSCICPRQLLPAWLYLLHPCSRAPSSVILVQYAG